MAEAVTGCHEHGVPLLALGNGSNLLVSDSGVEGLVLRPLDNEISFPEGSLLHAAAGTRMVKVAQAAGKAGLTGWSGRSASRAQSVGRWPITRGASAATLRAP